MIGEMRHLGPHIGESLSAGTDELYQWRLIEFPHLKWMGSTLQQTNVAVNINPAGVSYNMPRKRRSCCVSRPVFAGFSGVVPPIWPGGAA